MSDDTQNDALQDDAPDTSADDTSADDGVQAKSDEGTAASHPPFQVRPFRVAPTLSSDFNVLSLDVPTVACLSLNDILFAFDSSFLTPDAAKVLSDLPGLRAKHKNSKGELAPLSVFGHADPVGDDTYNKVLSGRRARAVYGLLLHDVSIWESLYASPAGGDDWSAKNATKIMRDATGRPSGTARKDLMAAYMLLLFPQKLSKTDFLGRGAASNGKADFQGCSEFNPLTILSKKENATLGDSERNRQNQPNRRVVIFLFSPGRKVNAQAWPCPAASEGIAGCKARFFSDGEKRRTAAPDQRREFTVSHDTFACRFYDRMARLSPCEGPVPPVFFGVKPLVFVAAGVPADASASSVKAPAAAPAPAPPPVAPSVGAARGVVVVAKPHTKPSRVAVVLKTDTPFSGTGQFDASPADTIQFFKAAKGGTAIAFDGKQNVFPGAALTKGLTLFAQGAKASAAIDDVKITLTLKGGAKKINNNPGQAKMTSVDVTLQICKVRTAAGADPPVLTEAEKINPGRAVHVQTKDNKRRRAMLIVQKAKPAAFAGKLVLSAKDASVKLFTNETFTAGESSVTTPKEIDNSSIPAAGQKFFVEGAAVSAKFKDTGFTLGIKDVEADADHVVMTVIQAKLDLCKARDKAGKDPDPFTDDDKIKVGRALHLQDATNSRHRAMVIARQIKPADFAGTLVLSALDAKVKLFQNEKPAAGEAALASPLEIAHDAKFPATGAKRFLEGASLSGALIDTGVKLGVKDVEDECDRVAATVFQIEKVSVKLRGTPCKRNGSLANNMPAKTFNKDSKTFDATAFTVVRECGDLEMEATVKPAVVQISWDIQRAADDDAALKGEPTHAANGGNTKRKVTANATGSFHVFAFVDTNGTTKRNDEEDGVTVNLNMVEIKVLAGAANNKIVINARYSNTRSNASTLVVDSGTSHGVFSLAPSIGASYTDAEFVKHAIGMKVVVTLTGGGPVSRRGVDKVTLGYNQTTTADSVVGTYADGRTEKETIFVLPIPAANLGPGGQVISNPAPPAAPLQTLAFPVRDTRGGANNGTGIFIISSTDNDKKNLPKGEQRTCRFIDPPAIAIDLVHPVTGAALASIAGSNDFEDFLVGFSSDWDENFVAIAHATWKTTYGTFTAAGGWTNAGAAVTTAGAMTVFSPPVKGETTSMERCPPNFVDNLQMDAR